MSSGSSSRPRAETAGGTRPDGSAIGVSPASPAAGPWSCRRQAPVSASRPAPGSVSPDCWPPATAEAPAEAPLAKRILFSGSMAGHAVGYGGNTWAFLQWLLGFRRLGFDVYYVEERRAGEFMDESLKPVPFMESANARYFRQVIERFDLGDRAALLEAGSSAHVGLSREDIEKVAGKVALFVNQFGAYTAVLGRVRRSVYLDLDPGHTQIWQERYGVDMGLRGHDLYLTIGLNLGESDCPLPTCGIRWEKTLFPIVLSEWQTHDPPGSTFTTVANWRDYNW